MTMTEDTSALRGHCKAHPLRLLFRKILDLRVRLEPTRRRRDERRRAPGDDDRRLLMVREVVEHVAPIRLHFRRAEVRAQGRHHALDAARRRDRRLVRRGSALAPPSRVTWAVDDENRCARASS